VEAFLFAVKIQGEQWEPAGGGRMNLLFICSQNKRRSLTAEKIFDGYHGHRAFSAGTESNARIKVTPGLLKRADIIFCMEKKHVRRLREKYPDIVGEKEVVCLNISDDYGFMDRELQEILKDCVYEHI
jgi:predicted protein tyrosine phosphatase